MKLMMRVGSLLVVAAMAMGCPSGDDDDDNGGTINITALGGTVILAAGGGAQLASAEFYSAVSPEVTIVFDSSVMDTCVEDFAIVPGNPTVTQVDVGSDVTFTNGATTITAPVDTSGGGFSYGTIGAGSPPTGTYDIAVAGAGSIPAGSVGSVSLPAAATLSGTPTITPGSDLDITWTGGSGATLVSVDMEDSGQTVSWTCLAAPDGAFTIPGSVTTAIGTGGSISLTAVSLNAFAFEGRDVLAVGAGL